MHACMCGVLLLELGSNHINIRTCLSLGHLRCVLQGGLGGNVVISCHPRISRAAAARVRMRWS
jgi:hypothetical protein